MEECVEISAGGLQTSILVDGKRVAHYAVEVENRGKATSWITSEVDKEFAINVSVESLPKSNAYGVLVYIDGLLVSSSFFCADSEKRSRIITGVRVSQTEKRKFMFGALEFLGWLDPRRVPLTTDYRAEDESSVEAASAKKPGQIGIVLQTSTSPETRRPPDAPDPFVVPTHDKVYEGSSKGMAHQVKYSEPHEDRLASPKKLFHLKDPVTVAKHVIKYRPLEILQANGIVSLPPPSAAEIIQEISSSESQVASQRPRKRRTAEGRVKAEVETEEADPEERIRKRRRELMAELAKLQEEEDSLRASKRTGKPVKHEIKHEPRATIASGEVIDLTL